MSNTDLVMSFIRAWENRDTQAILDGLAPDAFYHNIPMEPLKGTEAIKQFVAPFLETAEKVEWEVHHIAENAEGTVLTERTDNFYMGDGKKISVRVMGTFELKNGKITSWRDYFDLAEFQSQMA